MDATTAYLENEDALAAWLDDKCELDASNWESSKVLFASWKNWAELAGEFVGSRKQFAEKLETRGIEPRRLGKGRERGFLGIKLIETEPSLSPRYPD
jgi:putative DNA primase/helicase